MPEVLVQDCSVAAKWVLPEPNRESAIRIFDEYQQAPEAFRLMEKCAPQLFDTRPLVPYALELSLRHQLSLWDCVYLALAIERDCAFLTADRRFFRGMIARPAVARSLGESHGVAQKTLSAEALLERRFWIPDGL